MSCDSPIPDQVLSDVHASLPSTPASLGHADLSESRFCFKLPKSIANLGREEDLTLYNCKHMEHLHHATSGRSEGLKTCSERTNDAYQYDEDGDLVLKRAATEEQPRKCIITIVHKMATDLSMVGQQVWLGALLLCDFILHYSALFEGCSVLDLGAGVGLTSIVAGFMAKTVFCTDHGDDILKLACMNVERNRHLLPTSSVQVREIDWKADSFLKTDFKESSSLLEPYRLTDGDVDMLCSCSIILAAEVIYDLELTDAFFCLLYKLLLKTPTKIVYMTVEKRQLFTIADKEVVSPAYEHFRENLEDLCGIDEGPVRFVCSQVNTSFPQYFEYQRAKELELWKIETIFPHG
ncbi:methyltransferase-like protein 22 [Littorina saxatilis]|uniref:Methyltransferase-like protein 22 n=1 Tax=Littorina saxatilis TaxID=31220 RepID=A0AAN9BUW8_9CAEN